MNKQVDLKEYLPTAFRSVEKLSLVDVVDIDEFKRRATEENVGYVLGPVCVCVAKAAALTKLECECTQFQISNSPIQQCKGCKRSEEISSVG